jgi:hypothetical protein
MARPAPAGLRPAACRSRARPGFSRRMPSLRWSRCETYAGPWRTLLPAGRPIPAGYAPRGASRPQKARPTGPSRGVERPGRVDALRAIDSTACPRSLACLRPAPPAAASDARPHRHPAWGPQHRRRLDPSPQRRSAVGVGHAECLRSGCWALRPARKVQMPNWNWSVEMRASSAARPGRPEPAWRSGGPARWHREVRRSDDAASGRALSAPVAATDAG